MKKSKRTLGAFTFQVHAPDSPSYPTISRLNYFKFINELEYDLASKLSFQFPKELVISRANVQKETRTISKLLAKKRKIKCHLLSLEILDPKLDIHGYDNICEYIHLAIKESNTVKPWCILIIVSNPKDFQESVLLERQLIPSCKKNNISLILASNEHNFKPIILNQGKITSIPELSPFMVDEQEEDKDTEVARILTPDEIAKLFQLISGHFVLSLNNQKYHLSAVASVINLAMNRTFINQLNNDILEKLKSKNYRILSFGIPAGGMDELAFNLAEGQIERIWYESKLSIADDRPVAIICDFLSSIYPVEQIIAQLKESGVTNILLVGIAKGLDVPIFNSNHIITYIETSFVGTNDPNTNCRFCKQEVQTIEGDYFDKFVRNIYEFDAYTFWEFVAQNKSFYEVGHWRSNRTPNHYLFRLITGPIFKKHSYEISQRLRNVLVSKNILTSWIKKIVCTEGEESYELSLSLAEIVGLGPKDVVSIPRKFFSSIAGKEFDKELLKYIDANYGEVAIRKSNVIIVDQAAHHFKTFSALRNICEYYDCTVLAFIVFIDRSPQAFSLGEYLHDSHYIALYHWSVPPRLEHECPCVG